ncbi:MAG: hypothetical protein K0S54_3173 [Alphaproteobacteria bacterium]|jgi:hypothetical protein|nr:hypothetical protein [Alphaproteobacteria bacterium]
MPPEIIALIDKPFWFAAVLAVGAFIGMAIESIAMEMRRRAWRKRNPGGVNNGFRPRDAADQLRIVMAAQFSARPILNKSEARVFKDLDRMVLSCNPGWQVMAQVSLGEILGSPDKQAYLCINSKRVDLLLVDELCNPRHVFEYQGGGHYQGTAAARDAVKKEALRRAGITYHEVVGGHTTAAELRQLVERLVPCARIAS